MDLDRYLANHKPAWERLEQLNSGGRRGAKRLRDDEIDELVGLYRRTSSNLSYVRTYYRDPALIAYLTRLVSASGAIIYSTQPRNWRNLGRFFTTSFPAAVWNARRAILLSFALFFVPALASGLWIANSDSAADVVMPPAVRDAYVNESFEEYYDSERASEFSSSVFTNNVQVAITAFGSGVAFGIPTVFILVFNGASIGSVAGLFDFVGQNAKFYGLITPHGLLELTAVIVAGASGLRLGWSLIAPGDQSRSASLTNEARRAIVILMGLVPTFAVAGLIEGFVTGQPWPTALRVGIGVAVEIAFVLYILTQGRNAERKGFTGALDEADHAGWVAKTA